MKRILLTISSVALLATSYGQMSIPTLNSAVTEDFNSFDASGFVAAPAAGQLDSDSWRIIGLSDAVGEFGGDYTSGDFTRGTSPGGVTSGGFYAFNNGSDAMLGVQPTGGDWTPGAITLKVQNNTGSVVGSLDVSYKIWVLNNGERGNSFNFNHGADTNAMTNIAAQDFTSTDAADGAPTWVQTTKTFSISGLNIADGTFYYLEWESADDLGGGSRDEFGLDDVSVTAQAAAACTQPTITTIDDLDSCDSAILPVITGTDLTGNEAYYTGLGGTGTSYDAGDVITSDVTLYAYDADGACTYEDTFDIHITLRPMIDVTADVVACDSFQLVAITGTNLTGNMNYDFELGSGDPQVGDWITADSSIIAWDFTDVTGCSDADTFQITIISGPEFDNVLTLAECDSVELEVITGTNLSGNEAYYTGPNGTGDMLSPGDYITTDGMVYIFDETGTTPNCVADEVITIDVTASGSAGNDIDSSIFIGNIIDLDGLIDGDLGGDFIETTMPLSGQFNNTTNEFDANGLTPGVYTFDYIVNDCDLDTAIITITVEDIESIFEMDEANFNMYPNPTKDVINIEGQNFDTYKIIDLSGKTIASDIFNTQKISVVNLKEGMYILELSQGNAIARKRFVKK